MTRSYLIKPLEGQRGYFVEYWIVETIGTAESVDAAKRDIIAPHRAKQPDDGQLVWESTAEGKAPVAYGRDRRCYAITKMHGRFTLRVDGEKVGVFDSVDAAKAAAEAENSAVQP